MAVVKSPKNNKRKFLWIKSLETKNIKQIVARKKVTAHNRKITSTYWTSVNMRTRLFIKASHSTPYFI